MGKRVMNLTLISARELKKPSGSCKTKAYAVAWISNDQQKKRISNDQQKKQRTPVDKNNGNHPNWNHAMKFTLDEAALQQDHLRLEIAVYDGSGDKEIGRTSIPVNTFLQPGATSAQSKSYLIHKPSGTAQGHLNLSVKLEKKEAKEEEKKEQVDPQAVARSYGAYPFYPPAGSSSHLPPNNQYPPPQAGYPLPPPCYQCYAPPPYQGYPPYPSDLLVVPAAQQPARKNNRPGMGLGAGLIGGALGGLLLGEVLGGLLLGKVFYFFIFLFLFLFFFNLG